MSKLGTPLREKGTNVLGTYQTILHRENEPYGGLTHWGTMQWFTHMLHLKGRIQEQLNE